MGPVVDRAAVRRALAASALAVLALTAACSAPPGRGPGAGPAGHGAPPPAGRPAPGAGAAPADPAVAQRSAVLAAYRGMWEQTQRIWASGSFTGTRLTDFARDAALDGLRADAVFYQRHDIELLGAPRFSPRVTSLDLTASPPRATIRDCVDNTTYLPYYHKNDKPADVPPQPVRRTSTSTAERHGHAWLITEFTYGDAGSC